MSGHWNLAMWRKPQKCIWCDAGVDWRLPSSLLVVCSCTVLPYTWSSHLSFDFQGPRTCCPRRRVSVEGIVKWQLLVWWRTNSIVLFCGWPTTPLWQYHRNVCFERLLSVCPRAVLDKVSLWIWCRWRAAATRCGIVRLWRRWDTLPSWPVVLWSSPSHWQRLAPPPCLCETLLCSFRFDRAKLILSILLLILCVHIWTAYVQNISLCEQQQVCLVSQEKSSCSFL